MTYTEKFTETHCLMDSLHPIAVTGTTNGTWVCVKNYHRVVVTAQIGATNQTFDLKIQEAQDAAATSAGDAAARAPCAVSFATAFASMSNTVRRWPFFRILAAIGPPMIPRPMKPTAVISTPSFCRRNSSVELRASTYSPYWSRRFVAADRPKIGILSNVIEYIDECKTNLRCTTRCPRLPTNRPAVRACKTSPGMPACRP